MYWSESEQPETFVVPDNVVDMVFRINCRRLPVDHAWTLSRAVIDALPWIADEKQAGIHLVHGAESGNGWQRPPDDDYLLLSRRARFTLRIPRQREDEARELCGRSFELDDCRMDIGDATIKLLSNSAILFSRHLRVVSDPDSEENFLSDALNQLHAMRIRPRKMMCGRLHQLRTPEGPIPARSLMVADLTPEQSIDLQESGLGDQGQLGLGIFIPHKGIDAVYQRPDEQ